MPKYLVTLSRQKPQTAQLWIQAANEETAGEDAMDIALDGDAIWHDDDSAETHSVSVENIREGVRVGRVVYNADGTTEVDYESRYNND